MEEAIYEHEQPHTRLRKGENNPLTDMVRQVKCDRYSYQCDIDDVHLCHAVRGALPSPRVILVGKKSSWPLVFLVLI